MRIEDCLKEKIYKITPGVLRDAMEYSLLAGGKRIRPNLLYSVVKGYGLQEEIADEFACALEMIHTYSLIHDDLPAMDNDDLRRGRLTCHKQFDEATAILAGDGLLTYAFSTASSSKQNPAKVCKCIAILAEMAGPDGMVLGQVYDMNEQINSSDWEYLKKVHHYKTGCLLSAPLMMGAVLSDKDDSIVEQWHEVGNAIGLAFHIQDDILDVRLTAEEFGKSNSDARNDKVTSVTLLGEDKAEHLMNQLYLKAEDLICSLDDFNAQNLLKMLEEIRARKK